MSRIIPAGRRRPAAAPLPQRRISFSLRMKRILRAWQLYVLLAPAVLYILVFKYWPMYGGADRLPRLQPRWRVHRTAPGSA